jgi:hypothetical protein
VLVACHHPAVSGDSRYGGSDGLADEIDQAAHVSGLWPDAVLCGHAQLYQRFTRRPVSGIEIPYIVTGSGGTSVIPPQAAMPSAPVTIGDYTLDVNPVAEPGHLTVTVDMGGVSPELTIAWTGLTTRDQVSIDLALRSTIA